MKNLFSAFALLFLFFSFLIGCGEEVGSEDISNAEIATDTVAERVVMDTTF